LALLQAPSDWTPTSAQIFNAKLWREAVTLIQASLFIVADAAILTETDLATLS
jgi:hypothetical protein